MRKMRTAEEKIAAADWQRVTENMHDQGYAVLKNILTAKDCAGLISNYQNPDGYRKTVVIIFHDALT